MVMTSGRKLRQVLFKVHFFNEPPEILNPLAQTVTGDAVELWADRAMGDFERKVGKNAISKQKAGLMSKV